LVEGPSAPFIAAHSSFPQAPDVRALWLDRYRNFAVAGGAPAGDAEHWRRAVEQQLTLLSPEADEELLREAGFTDATGFYAAFTASRERTELRRLVCRTTPPPGPAARIPPA